MYVFFVRLVALLFPLSFFLLSLALGVLLSQIIFVWLSSTNEKEREKKRSDCLFVCSLIVQYSRILFSSRENVFAAHFFSFVRVNKPSEGEASVYFFFEYRIVRFFHRKWTHKKIENIQYNVSHSIVWYIAFFHRLNRKMTKKKNEKFRERQKNTKLFNWN